MVPSQFKPTMGKSLLDILVTDDSILETSIKFAALNRYKIIGKYRYELTCAVNEVHRRSKHISHLSTQSKRVYSKAGRVIKHIK